MWRAVSFGRASRRASECIERIPSTAAILGNQGRYTMPCLREACQAALAAKSAPFLVSLGCRVIGDAA